MATLLDGAKERGLATIATVAEKSGLGARRRAGGMGFMGREPDMVIVGQRESYTEEWIWTLSGPERRRHVHSAASIRYEDRGKWAIFRARMRKLRRGLK